MYSITDFKDPQLTVKILGHQWYWSYEISDIYLINRKMEMFLSWSLVWDSYLAYPKLDVPRLLEVDRPLFLPIFLPLRLVITATDVIHS